MYWASGVFALVGAVVIGVLARFIARGGGPRTVLWIVLLAISVVLGSFLASVAFVYHRMPPGWIVILVLALAVFIVLFVRVGKDLGWKIGRMLGAVALLVVTLMLSTLAMMFMPMGGFLMPVFETAAGQIAQEYGFTLLLPPDEDFITEYNPITELDGEGVSLEFQGFTLQERKADTALDSDALRSIFDEGTRPIGEGSPPITDAAVYEEFGVAGGPALGVEYEDSMSAEKQNLGLEAVRVLVFERDGAEVRIFSHGYMRYDGQENGRDRYTPVDAMPFDEMLRIAGSLEPVE